MSGPAASMPIPTRCRRRCNGARRSAFSQEKAGEGLIRQVWRVMERAHWHSFQVLTKRPELMLHILSKPDFPTLSNVWLGTSVESEDYLSRIDLLRRVPAGIRF